MVLVAGWTYLWISGLVTLWSQKASDGDPDSTASSPPPSTFDTVFIWSSHLLWSIGACAAIGVGIAGCVVVFGHFVKVALLAVEPLATYLKHWFQPEDPEAPEEFNDARIGWLEWASSIIPPVPNTSNILGGRKCLHSVVSSTLTVSFTCKLG